MNKFNENFALVGCEKFTYKKILVTSECDQAHDMDVRWVGTRLPWKSSVCTSSISSMLAFLQMYWNYITLWE